MMTSPINQILQGDALTKLKELESESVDCICTSPPYWALRDYKTEGTIWDEDNSNNCEHEFQIKSREINLQAGNPEFKRNWREQASGKVKTGKCSKCNAWKGELGQEPTIDLYINHLIQIFNEAKRILKKTGTCWVVLGDTYSTKPVGSFNGGSQKFFKGRDMSGVATSGQFDKTKQGIPDKSLCMIPERFAIAMIDKGWILRNKIIWHKRNCMPSSAKDRYTIDYEFIYFFSKSQKYYFKTQYEPIKQDSIARFKRGNSNNHKWIDGPAGQTPHSMSQYRPNDKTREWVNSEGRIKRCVWTINTKPFSEAHFAVFPEELVKQCIDAGCPSEICVKCGKTKSIEYIRPERPEAENRDKRFDNDNNRKVGQKYQNWLQANPTIEQISSCNCNAGFESGIVLDPFMGSGTTALVALKHNMRFVGIELNEDYIKKIAMKRLERYLYEGKLTNYIKVEQKSQEV